MKFDIFAFFKKYPVLAVIILAGLAIYTSTRLTREAQIDGIIPGLTTIEGTVERAYTKEVNGRWGRTVEACFVAARSEAGFHEVRIDCDDSAQYDVGSTVELLKDGDSIESRSFSKGHFMIDLLLFIAEIVGIVYYFRLAAQRKAALA